MATPVEIEHARLRDGFYRALYEAAGIGAPCPTIEQLKDRFGVSKGTLTRLFRELETMGEIRMTGKNQFRRITITRTGKSTAPVVPKRMGPMRSSPLPKGEDLEAELAAAKLFVQRRGYPVFRAKTVNPKADPGLWVIGGFGPRFTDADLMDFARSRGWKQQRRAA